ncbi:MAG: insulinase family protein [Alphaproteobacteria bacterium]|nr:insulinase family protein [Alphaproteobacteria bacterium]
MRHQTPSPLRGEGRGEGANQLAHRDPARSVTPSPCPLPGGERVLVERVLLGCLLVVGLVLFAAAPARAVNVERVASPGGIEAWLVEDHTVPVVSIEFLFRAGAAIDPAGKDGLSRFAASLLDEAAGDLPNQEFQRRLEDLVSQLNYNAGLDSISGSLKTLKQNLAPSAELLRLSLTAPRFDAGDVERLRAQLQVLLAREAEEPHAMAQRAWFRAAFPNHPYGRGSRGTPDGLAAVTVDDLKDWTARHLTRDVLVIGVAGDIAAAELAPLLDQVFGALPATAQRPSVPDAAPADPGQLMQIERQLPQSVVLFGKSGIKRGDPDYYAAYILNHILGGGGFGSRLVEEVREKRGLAYSVSSSLALYDHAPLMQAQTATKNASVEQAVQLVRAEWARLAEKGPTLEELADAKTYLTGSFPLQLDSTGRIAQILVSLQVDHLGIDYLDRRNALLEGVTLEQAQRVAQRLFDPKPLSIVVVGPPGELKTTRPAPSGG